MYTIHIYIYIYTHTYIHTYIITCLDTCLNVCLFVCTYPYTHALNIIGHKPLMSSNTRACNLSTHVIMNDATIALRCGLEYYY